MTEVQRFSAHRGSHFENLTGWQNGRIPSDRFGNEGRQPHLFEHIKVIVGSRPIGS